jgi:hypothetical protein
MVMIKEGTYEAKVINYGIGRTKKGGYQAVVKFGFYEDNEPKTLKWYGGFGPTQTNITLRSLFQLGLNGPLESLADGARSGVLNIETNVFIEVEHNTYTDNFGKERTNSKIRSISKSAAGIDDVVGRDEFRQAIQNMGIDQELSMLLRDPNAAEMTPDFGDVS